MSGGETHHRLVLIQRLIVLRNGDKEYESGHILETMDPFLPLGSLTTDIEPNRHADHMLRPNIEAEMIVGQTDMR